MQISQLLPDRMGIAFDVELQGNACKWYVRMLMLWAHENLSQIRVYK